MRDHDRGPRPARAFDGLDRCGEGDGGRAVFGGVVAEVELGIMVGVLERGDGGGRRRAGRPHGDVG